MSKDLFGYSSPVPHPLLKADLVSAAAMFDALPDEHREGFLQTAHAALDLLQKGEYARRARVLGRLDKARREMATRPMSLTQLLLLQAIETAWGSPLGDSAQLTGAFTRTGPA